MMNKKLSQVIPYFCTQIACIKYNAGKKTDVKNCGRLVGVTYSNKKRTKFGRLNRVDIGLKDDSRIVIWKRRKSDSAVQVSTFAFDNKIKRNYSGHPSPYIRISNTSCSFSPLTRLKMLIWGGSPIRI